MMLFSFLCKRRAVSLSEQQKMTGDCGQEMSKPKRYSGWLWILWVGLILNTSSSQCFALDTPDAGGDNAENTVPAIAITTSSAATNSESKNWVTTDASFTRNGRAFWIFLPDNEPSGDSYGATFYSFNSTSNAVSIPPLVSTTPTSCGSSETSTYKATLTLADSETCEVTLKTNGGDRPAATMTFTLSRSGNIYTLTNGTVCDGNFVVCAPTNFTATVNASNTQIDLNWTDNSANETGFYIMSGTGIPVDTTAPDVTSYSVTGLDLECGKKYSLFLQAKATNADNSSSFVIASATTDACPLPTVDLTAITNSPTQSSTVSFEATFSESVTGFEDTDIDLSSSTVSNPSATILSGTGAGPYTIQVTGYSGTGDIVVKIPAGAATANGQENTASNASTITIADNGVTLTPSGFAIEGISEGNYTLQLNTVPAGAVEITMTPDSQCTITSDNPVSVSDASAIIVTFAAVNDTDVEGHHFCEISHQITASADTANYPTTMNIADVSAEVCDDDPGVIIEPTSINISENGTTASYNVRLSAIPADDITLTLTPDSQLTLDKTTLTFSAGLTALDPQTVTVTANDDSSIEGNHTGSISHSITTGNTAYPENMTIANVTANITDNDTPPPPPAPTYYNLDLKTNGTGNGEITGKTSDRYTSGTRVELVAEPAADSVFIGWEPETCGDVFYLSSDTTCTATFDLATFSLSVETAGGGSGQVTADPQGDSHLANTTISLTATPDDGSTLDRWTPESCGQPFQLITDTQCTAWFETAVVPEPEPQPEPEPTPENTPPQVITPLPDHVITLGDSLSSIMLDDYFTDNGALSYQVVSSPLTDIAVINTNQLSFNTRLLQIGTVSFTVRATDTGNLFVEDSFLVTVGSPEPEPQPEPQPEPEPNSPDDSDSTTPVSATSSCPVDAEEYGNTCNAGGNNITMKQIMSYGVVANGIIDQLIENDGWLLNIQVTANGHIKGGKLSGSVENQGVIEDFEFKGKLLEGGVLGGHIRNTSSINGLIKNVKFKAGSVLEGGKVGGEITGDPTDPVRLTGVTLTNGSHLSHVIIDDSSKLPDNVTFGAGVRFASEFPCQGNGLSLQHGEQPNACFKVRNGTVQITTVPDHRGQAAEVIFAATDAQANAYSYDGQNWQQIPVDIAEILTAETVDPLPLTLEVALPDLSDFIAVFVGYRLADGEIVFQQVK